MVRLWGDFYFQYLKKIKNNLIFQGITNSDKPVPILLNFSAVQLYS